MLISFSSSGIRGGNGTCRTARISSCWLSAHLSNHILRTQVRVKIRMMIIWIERKGLCTHTWIHYDISILLIFRKTRIGIYRQQNLSCLTFDTLFCLIYVRKFSLTTTPQCSRTHLPHHLLDHPNPHRTRPLPILLAQTPQECVVNLPPLPTPGRYCRICTLSLHPPRRQETPTGPTHTHALTIQVLCYTRHA